MTDFRTHELRDYAEDLQIHGETVLYKALGVHLMNVCNCIHFMSNHSPSEASNSILNLLGANAKPLSVEALQEQLDRLIKDANELKDELKED